MFRALLSVGGFTLLSRASGFARDIVMAAILGHGALSDTFLVALRLPNHFRQIFAEGAYNAAFIPLYSSLRHQSSEASRAFSRNMLGWQIAFQTVLFVAAMATMPWVVGVLALGYLDQPEQMTLAIDLTRITFVYLFCVSIVTHLGDMLNAERTFWPAAVAPIGLNGAMIAMLSVAYLFPTAAHAAAWGVFAGGFLELVLLIGAAAARGLPVVPVWPKLTQDVRVFAVRFGPAVLGAAGVQIAIFADTMLATLLEKGDLTSLYYADRINQLPMGVVGVALGTVLLPELSRAVVAGNETQAARSFNRATELGLLLTLPFVAMFFAFPNAITTGLFARGAFNIAAAEAAGAVLVAYAIGLPAFVLLRTVTPLFHARGDTRTPVLATVAAIVINLAAKLVLIFSFAFGAVGLALGTAVGAWVNLVLLIVVAAWRGILKLDERLTVGGPRILAAAVFAGVVAWLASWPIADALAGVTQFRNEIYMMLLGAIATVNYGVALIGLGWKR